MNLRGMRVRAASCCIHLLEPQFQRLLFFLITTFLWVLVAVHVALLLASEVTVLTISENSSLD